MARPSFHAGVVGGSRVDPSHELGGMYPGKLSSKQRALTYRQHFIARWSAFIRANFESPEHAAMVFGVDGSTARKWWDGLHAPSGFAVGYAYENMPDRANKALRGQQ